LESGALRVGRSVKIVRMLRSIAERLLRPEIARFVSALGLVMVAVVGVAVFVTDRSGGPALGLTLGGDFAQFYAVGVLQNEYGSARIYDLILHDEILHREVRAVPRDQHLPFVYPPIVAAVFRPLALLPYHVSFLMWLVLSLGFYAAAIALTLRVCRAIPRSDRETVWWLALSFPPFAFECWLGGQLSSFGCLAMATALVCARSGRPFLAGVAFSLLLYKPPLLLLVVPMLLVGLRWRLLAGLAAGAMAFATLSVIAAGSARCLEFGRLMLTYARLGSQGWVGFRATKYIDLTAFFQLLGARHDVARVLAIALSVPPFAALIAVWRRAARREVADLDLPWAATLCWTPLLSVYSPVYDSAVIVPGLLLGADAIRRGNSAQWPLAFRALVALVYGAAAVAPWLAEAVGFQPLTLGLAAMGTYVTRAAFRNRNGAVNLGYEAPRR
jgi:hypothetical protein